MKKSWIIIVAIVAILFFWISGAYNGLVKMDENVKKAWGNVQTQYQRRLDLIDNLVETVKGETTFEQETLTQVIEARSKATSINIDADNMSQAQLNQLQAQQGKLNSALSRLMVVIERYPDLKSNASFRNLQVALEGSENRVSTARIDYNNAVNLYNVKVRTFPGTLIANMFGFKVKPLFEADEKAQEAPKVNFDKEAA